MEQRYLYTATPENLYTSLCRKVAIESGGQLERVAHGNFGGAEPSYGKILNLHRFEFGTLDCDTAYGQPPNSQSANRESANCHRADRSGYERHAAIMDVC